MGKKMRTAFTGRVLLTRLLMVPMTLGSDADEEGGGEEEVEEEGEAGARGGVDGEVARVGGGVADLLVLARLEAPREAPLGRLVGRGLEAEALLEQLPHLLSSPPLLGREGEGEGGLDLL